MKKKLLLLFLFALLLFLLPMSGRLLRGTPEDTASNAVAAISAAMEKPFLRLSESGISVRFGKDAPLQLRGICV